MNGNRFRTKHLGDSSRSGRCDCSLCGQAPSQLFVKEQGRGDAALLRLHVSEEFRRARRSDGRSFSVGLVDSGPASQTQSFLITLMKKV